MDAIQRSEFNNQTDNGANEKWVPGAKGDTKDDGQPLDHTWPQGNGVQQQGNQQLGNMGTQQTGAGPGAVDGQFDRSRGGDAGIPGGSMETQINGGSGAVQGITDSHQRQMEQKSAAYGELELPVGHRPKEGGVHLNQQRDMQGGPRAGSQQYATRGGGMYGPDYQGSAGNGSAAMHNYQSAMPSGTQGGGMPGPESAIGTGHGNGQEAQHGNMQRGVAGSHSASNQHSDAGGVHQSNDAAGGLPRSPGSAGADHAASYDRTGSQTGPGAAEQDPTVQESNDAAGGYPRSPGYANRLNGDSNMDDDTGFKRKS